MLQGAKRVGGAARRGDAYHRVAPGDATRVQVASPGGAVVLAWASLYSLTAPFLAGRSVARAYELIGTEEAVDAASRALESRGPAATLPDLVSALTALRDLQAQTGAMGLSDSGKYEIEPRLRLKERQLQDAIVLAQGVRIDATASDGLVVPGQRVNVTIAVGNRGAGELGVARLTMLGFDGPGNSAPGVATVSAPYYCEAELTAPSNARLSSQPTQASVMLWP